jgi:uncharacterized protein DUF4234
METNANPVSTDDRIRNPAVVLILTLITCGLYALLWIWQVGTELKAYLGREDINPGLDVVLTLLTGGLWAIYLMYRYPRLVLEAQAKVHVPPHDISLVSVLLALFGLPFVSMLLVQTELNKIWAAAAITAV